MLKKRVRGDFVGWSKNALELGVRAFLPNWILVVCCQGVLASSMIITSTAFKNNETIPSQFVQHSPALAWTGAPAAAKSFAIICHDPDAPNGHFVHWVAYDIPPAKTSLAVGAGAPAQHEFRQGINGFERLGWNGPMPPPGKVHHYLITVYALDAMLGDLRQPHEEQLKPAMTPHILAQATLVGTYKR